MIVQILAQTDIIEAIGKIIEQGYGWILLVLLIVVVVLIYALAFRKSSDADSETQLTVARQLEKAYEQLAQERSKSNELESEKATLQAQCAKQSTELAVLKAGTENNLEKIRIQDELIKQYQLRIDYMESERKQLLEDKEALQAGLQAITLERDSLKNESLNKEVVISAQKMKVAEKELEIQALKAKLDIPPPPELGGALDTPVLAFGDTQEITPPELPSAESDAMPASRAAGDAIIEVTKTITEKDND